MRVLDAQDGERTPKSAIRGRAEVDLRPQKHAGCASLHEIAERKAAGTLGVDPERGRRGYWVDDEAPVRVGVCSVGC